DQQQAKFAALDAQVKRLEAELAGRDYASVAGNTPDEQLQLQLFEQRRAYRIAQLDNFDQQMAAQDATISASKDQETILDRRRDGLVQIEQARETLYKQETGSLLNLLSSRDARLDVEACLASLRGKETEANDALATLE
ncbi:HlyD family type I secretion periplasmic adaptor subunit, partial [Rhizobiaceae sp. 2RAB30]